MTDIFNFLAQATDGAPVGPLDSILKSGFLFPLALMIMFYFLLIRPQQKQKKELAARIAGIKKGDKVITVGGIHGVVNHKGDTTVSLKVSEGVFITMDSVNISTVLPSGSTKEEAPAKADGKK